MQFVKVPLAESIGSILGHNVIDGDGRRVLRKGRPLRPEDLEILRSLGRSAVYVARLEPGDVDENHAARRLARAAAGDGLRLSEPRTGRVNLYAEHLGVLRVELDRLLQLNTHEGISFSTLPRHGSVASGKMVATLKIIPYALPIAALEEAEQRLAAQPVIWLTPLRAQRAGMILSGAPSAQVRVIESFRAALEPRLHALGAELARIDFVSLDEDDGEERLAEILRQRLDGSLDLILLAGDTAIMDRFDITPRAVERAGAEIVSFGAPVDPGNLLLLAFAGSVPIVGAPGCARSPQQNIVDLVLPRLLAGDRIPREEIVLLGHGGLLDDVPERPLPRSWLR